MLEADQTSGTASPHGALARLSSQVSRHRVLLLAQAHMDTKRYSRSGEDHPAGKYVLNARSPSGRPHPVPLANNVDLPLAAHFCTVAQFGQCVQTHCPYNFSAYMAGP